MTPVTIKVDNSYSKINLKTDDFRRLRVLLSYTTGSYYSGRVFRQYLIDKTGNFPTGLLKQVLDFLTESKIRFRIVDKRKVPEAICNFTGYYEHDPYPDQRQAVEQATIFGRGGIVMPTGTGKSRVAAMLIERFNVRTLIVVPTLEIRNQLREDISKIFGKSPHIMIENIDSPRLKKEIPNVGMLIIDECHHAAAKTYQKLNKTVWKNIYYRFFLTATFFRNDSNEHLLFESIVGQEIFRLTDEDAVKRNYIVPVEAYYLDVPETPNDCWTWREVYNKLVVHNDTRNQEIAALLRRVIGQKTLCIVKEIEHGLELSTRSGYPFVYGEDEQSKKWIEMFKKGEINGLIGTSGVLGEGVDTKPAEYIVIAGLGKAKSSIMQWIGRGRRRWKDKQSCKVILFRDKSHKFCLRHFRSQCRVIKEEYGVKAVKI